MKDFFKKFIFLIERNPVVIVIGEDGLLLRKFASLAIKGKEGILIFGVDFKDCRKLNDLKLFLKKSKKPILSIAPIVGDAGQENSEEKPILMDRISSFAKSMPAYGYVLASFDHGMLRKIKGESSARIISYGLQQGADLLASDINMGRTETNFKANYQGYTVPFWIKNISKKDEIYLILAVIGIGIAQGFNLVEISQFLKSFDFSFGQIK